jgi:hypothetical protein
MLANAPTNRRDASRKRCAATALCLTNIWLAVSSAEAGRSGLKLHNAGPAAAAIACAQPAAGLGRVVESAGGATVDERHMALGRLRKFAEEQSLGRSQGFRC